MIIINTLLDFIKNSWLSILNLYYQIVLCGGTLLLTFYLTVKSEKSLRLLVEMFTIWIVLEGVSSKL